MESTQVVYKLWRNPHEKMLIWLFLNSTTRRRRWGYLGSTGGGVMGSWIITSWGSLDGISRETKSINFGHIISGRNGAPYELKRSYDAFKVSFRSSWTNKFQVTSHFHWDPVLCGVGRASLIIEDWGRVLLAVIDVCNPPIVYLAPFSTAYWNSFITFQLSTATCLPPRIVEQQ